MFGSSRNTLTDDSGQNIQPESCLVLYPDNFAFNCTRGTSLFFLINETALDPAYLRIDDSQIAYYYKSIYIRPGNFILYFPSESDLKLVAADASASLEVKAFNKYNIDFQFSKTTASQPIFQLRKFNNIPFRLPENIDETFPNQLFQPYVDKAVNHIKGAVYGFLLGVLLQKSPEQVVVLNKLNQLRNSLAGLKTAMEMDEHFDSRLISELKESIAKIEQEYPLLSTEDYKGLFRNIYVRLDELIKLEKSRKESLAELKLLHNSPQTSSFVMDSDAQMKLNLQEPLAAIRLVINHLDEARKAAKGSIKAGIAELIALAKAERAEIADALKVVNANIRNSYSKKPRADDRLIQFDGLIEDQHFKVSRYISDIIFLAEDHTSSSTDTAHSFPLTSLLFKTAVLARHFHSCSAGSINKLTAQVFDTTLEAPYFSTTSDKRLFVAIINAALFNAKSALGEISASQIDILLDDVITAVLQLPAMDESLAQELQLLKAYRESGQQMYSFPGEEQSVVLRNFIAFIFKPNSLEELRKYLVTQAVDDNYTACAIWGAFHGFANMPRTFTDAVLDTPDRHLIGMIDEYLFSNVLA